LGLCPAGHRPLGAGVLPTQKKQANFLKGAPVFVSALVAPVLAGVTGSTQKAKKPRGFRPF